MATTVHGMFIPKKFRKWAEDVMGVVVRAEQEKMYAQHKAEMKDRAEKSGIAKDRRERRTRARQIHGHIAGSVE